jgi:hypothetical protein
MKQDDLYFSRMQRINELIAARCTGTPAELASKLNMGLRNLYNYIDVLKDSIKEFNVNILYNQCMHTYEYDQPGKLEFGFNWKAV